MITYSPAMQYDPETRHLRLSLENPGNCDITEYFIEQMGSPRDNLVCLSGGLDSQAHALLLQKAGIVFDSVIYVAKWDDEVINASDVMMAESFCKKNGFSYIRFEVNFKDFLDTEMHLVYASNYGVTSPMIAFHLFFIDKLRHSGTLHMGSDVPMMYVNKDNEPKIKANSWALLNITLPYKTFADRNNLILVKDIFMASPQSLYLGYKHNIKTVEEEGIYCYIKNQYSAGQQQYKAAYYKALGFNVSPPLLKNTGFEQIKKYLASITGNYDEFDKRYREPMEKFSDINDFDSIKVRISGQDNLVDDFGKVCNQYGSPVTEYTFDF